MNDISQRLEGLAREVHREAALQREQIEMRWGRPLSDRVRSGRALGPLRLWEIETSGLVHFEPPREDYAVFRELEPLRLSRDHPQRDPHRAQFVGLTDQGLTIHLKNFDPGLAGSEGWTLDEDLVDLSQFYLEAIATLGNTAHGRDDVLPVLFGETTDEVDAAVYTDILDGLAAGDLDSSQEDALATALASTPFHLIQGPPGTGKTYTLARLVDQLVLKGHRVLVTGFTHRSIHEALAKIAKVIGEACPIVKISKPIPGQKIPVPVHASWSESGLADHVGPFVIGATPFALYTHRLKGTYFDSIVLDEASQLTIPAAAMAMLRGDRWFFFGDHRQLPPVTLLHRNDPSSASVFAQLNRKETATTLTSTYRLNAPLTAWPSESFYGGRLQSHQTVSANRLALKQPVARYPSLLARDPSLLRIEVNHHNCRTRSDAEADLAADILADLFDAGLDPAEAGVVVPFRSQGIAIKRLLRGDRFRHHLDALKTTIDTVERYQGQEREVVLYSFATSEPKFLARLDAFLFQIERLNVAVTRARTKVILLHSTALLNHARHLADYREDAAVFLSLLDAATLIEV